MEKTRSKTKENELSAIQKAAVEKFKILIKDYTSAKFPSFLYTQKEILKKIDASLSALDDDYIKKHNIPEDLVKNLAREIYQELMKKGDYDRAITVAEHYKL